MNQNKLSQREIETPFKGELMNSAYPAHLTLKQASNLLQLGRSTFYRRMAEGANDFAKVVVGGKTMFSRDRILKWYFNR